MDWITLLKPGARAKDTALFNTWARGEITTLSCIKWFKKNNRMPEKTVIDRIEFVRWLRLLGYIRKGENDG